MRYHYNDNELLYLISENNDSALEIMYLKYIPLIKKRIIDFKVKLNNQDDFFQEGLLMLDKAIKTYKPTYKKSFNKYFDLILQRRFIRIYKNSYNYFYNVTLIENFDFVLSEEKEENIVTLEEINTGKLSKFELKVLECAFDKKMDSKKISEYLECDVRKVYNALARAKKKIRDDNKRFETS